MQNHSDKYFRTYLLEKVIFRILFTFLILSGVPLVSAQNNTLYLMHSIPQANQLNPALMHPCRFYVSLPAISSVKMNLRNTGFGYHDVFYTGTGDQPDNYYVDLDKLENKLRRINYGLVSTEVDLLGFGFPVKDWYITFGIFSYTSSQASYPHDIVLLQDEYLDVNSGTAIPVSLKNLGVNSTAWNSIGISASKEVKEGLRVGARLKYLNGMANVHTATSLIDVNPTTDPVTQSVEVNYRINSSLPLELSVTPDGLVNSISFEPARHNLTGNYIFNGNRGLAIDGGIVYKIDETTQVSASFTDLGFIQWKKNLNSFSVKEKFIFNATDLDQFTTNPGYADLLNSLADSLLNSVYASTVTNSYFTATPFNLYGGITRELAPNIRAGAMTWIEINSGHLRPSLTLSLNFTPFKAFAAALSYTLMNNKFNQIGTGLAFGNHGAQFYIITDNIVVRYTKDAETSLVWPYNARMLSLRFGLNLFFGCDKKGNNKDRSDGNRHRAPKNKSRDSCAAYW